MADRRARRHEATRQEIIDAAWRLARERGLTGWSLREVAAAVDMRAPSLYVYFDSKDAIYDAMFADGYRDLLALVGEIATTDGPSIALRRGAQAFMDFCLADAARFQLLFLRVIPGFAPSGGSYALAEDFLERLRAQLAAAGVTAPGAVDLWTAVFTGLATQQLSNEPGGDRFARLVDPAIDMLLSTMSPDQGVAGPDAPDPDAPDPDAPDPDAPDPDAPDPDPPDPTGEGLRPSSVGPPRG